MAEGTPSAFEARLTALLKTPGTWTTVVVDESGTTNDPRGTAVAQRTSLTDRAKRAGASEADVAALGAALESTTGLPAPVTRVLLVADGVVAMDEAVPVATGAVDVEVGPLPAVLRLLELSGDDFGYVTVSVSRDGGDVALLRTGAAAPVSTATEEGRTDNLHLVADGGEGQASYQHRVEQQWKDNQEQVAARVDRVVQDSAPRLVVVSGDVAARGLLIDALSERSRELVAVYPKELRTEGADDSGLDAFIAERITAVKDGDTHDALDVLRARLGEHGAATTGTGAVVEALRESRVQQLMLDPGEFGDRTLLALDAEPWIAADPEDGAPASVAADVPAADAMVRSALLTGATIALVPASALAGDPVAALLRWADPA